MKKILTIFFCAITILVSAQDEIKGERFVKGHKTTDNFSFDYQAEIKYRLVLFGGVKFNLNVPEVRLWNIKYDGNDVPNSVLKSLDVEMNSSGTILVKRGLYDVKTDVEFRNCFFFDLRSDNGGCELSIKGVDVLSVGWGSLDEYTYLDDKEVKKLKGFFNLNKPDDFYTLDAELLNTKITKFNLGVLSDIKSEMNKLKSKKELIAQKLKALKALKPNKYLPLEKLKYKKELIEELIELEVEECLNNKSCISTLRDTEKAILIKEKEEGVALKLKKLKSFKSNNVLDLAELKSKKQLIEELIELEVEDCLSHKSCNKDLKEVERFIKKKLASQNVPEFISVTGGSFANGDYAISKTEVTVAQYRRYCNATGVSMPDTPSWGWQDNHPIVNVNWHDAIKYCDWLSELLSENITLPTEAQWEFAAQGGTQSNGYIYSGGNNLDTVGWYSSNSGGTVHPVASKKPNELGLYDMTGNVWERTLNNYDNANYKVIRGGSWINTATYCRVASRSYYEPDYRDDIDGFRVVSF